MFLLNIKLILTFFLFESFLIDYFSANASDDKKALRMLKAIFREYEV